MAEKAFLRIKEAEIEARVLIQNAKDQAAQMIRHVETESANAFLQLKESSRQQAMKKRHQAEANANAANAAFAKETEELCDALKRKLLSQKESAVGAIIQSILS